MSPTVLSQRIAEDGARRALAVPEILDYILQRLEPRALYHAALVCQFWKDVALNLLWSTAIVPFQAWMSLLSPISPFRVEDGTCLTFASQPPTIIALKRPRFFEYSSKIKKLVISNGLVPKSMAFVQMLTKRAGRTSLVPRLAHVIVQSEGRNVSPSSIIDSTAALSGKSTTTLKIDGTFPHKSIPQLFQSMVKGGAKIRDVQTEIELRGRYSLEVITFDLLPELRRCKCNAVTLAEGWPSLARCPRLRTLQVDTIQSYDESAENPMLEFKSLRELS
ncbi:hypothetical protein FRB99_003612 [Tulasnella sp. 403]|nr:hypothetical protein FRB99_003612 [Tulasnella sp. 403]